MDSPRAGVPAERIALVDLLDRLLAGGVVVSGEISLSVADVDLVTISLLALLASVSSLDQASYGGAEPAMQCRQHRGRYLVTQPLRYRLDADDDPRAAERGLAALVLTVVELLRQLMERQALRRVEEGSVTDEQAERLGYTLMRLDERMTELLEKFGLEREQLNIDLGPLGTLLPAEG